MVGGEKRCCLIVGLVDGDGGDDDGDGGDGGDNGDGGALMLVQK